MNISMREMGVKEGRRRGKKSIHKVQSCLMKRGKASGAKQIIYKLLHVSNSFQNIKLWIRVRI